MALTYEDLLGIQKKRKKREEEVAKKIDPSVAQEYLERETAPYKTVERNVKSGFTSDIAPTRTVSSTVTTSEKDEDEEKEWYEKIFKKPEVFDDGVQAIDIAKTILGTGVDLTFNALSGAGNFLEGITDTIGYGVADVSEALGANDFANATREKVKKNITQEILGNTIKTYDKWSVLDDTADSVAQGLGMIGTLAAGGAALGAAGLGVGATTAITTGATGLSGFGSGMGEAYQGGATDEEAKIYGVITGASEALSELLFGGLGKASKAIGMSKGLSSLDDIAAKKVANMFSNQFAKNLAEYGVKSGAEGAEEVISGVASIIGKKITYMSEKELGEIWKDEGLLEQFVVGSVTSSFAQANGLIKSASTGTDFITGLKENEQKVVDKEVENRIAELEKKGEKVTNKTKNKIYDAVIEDLDKGYIETDTIESVLGGEEYESYKSAKDLSDNNITQGKEVIENLKKAKDTLQAEYDTLNKMKRGEMTGEQIDRQNELKDKIADIESRIEKTDGIVNNLGNDTRLSDLKTKLGQSVFDLVKDSRLGESYREIARSQQKFEADTSKYKNENARQTVQNAIDSGLFRNSNADHDAVDFITKVTSKLGLVCEFTNNEKITDDYIELQTQQIAEFEKIPEAQRTQEQINKLAKMKNALEKVKSGKLKVNGNTKQGVITINLDSVEPVEFITGHELLHNLIKSKVYKNGDLHKAFKSYLGKEEYAKRLEKVKETYEGNEATPEEEFAANLVGEYIFNDYDFVMHLATTNHNMFRNFWDSIKHLYKMATAGSKEARQLERVKRNFEKAYKEVAKSGAKVEGTKHDIVALENGNVYVKASRKVINGTTVDEMRKDISHFFNRLLEENSSIDIPTIDGDVLTITKTETADKARDNYKTVNNQRIEMTNEEFTVKMHVEAHIDEVAEVSMPAGKKSDSKSHSFAKDGFTYRKAYFEDFDGEYYEVTLSIGQNGTVATVYNVGKIEKSVLPSAKISAVVGSKPLGKTLSKNSISQNSEKSSSTKHSLTETDNKYLSAVESGDTETAQRMVDEVAKKNGYTIHSYHGTRDKTFTEFKKDFIGSRFSFDDKGFFFIDRKSIADDYAHSDFDAKAYGRILDVYLKVKKPLMVDKNFCLKEGLGNPFRDDDAIGVWDAYSEFFKEEAENRKSDGIILDDGMSKMTVVFDPNQVKSADTVTYDDNGNVIPLSERFKAENNDIRYSLSEDSEGNKLTEKQSEYFANTKVIDEKGSLKVVYHGTRNADFTVFKRNATYFTDSKEMADSYSPNGAMFEGYVNITKPYEIDAAGEKWSRIPIDNDTANFLKEYGSSVFKEGGKWRTTPADIASALEEAIDNGDVDYDGIIIKNIDDTGNYYKDKETHLATDYIVFNSNQFKKVDNKAPTTDPDIRFSLSENVEETKDLMALHNLHSNELTKQLKMGGIPYPSVAVTKPDTLSHEGFGDVTLVLKKDAIDPKKSKYNKIYSADAYTPTFPSVSYEASRDVANSIADKVKSLYGTIPEDYKRSLTAFRDYTNIDERLNSARGEQGLVERYADDYSFKQLYLADKGEVVPTEIKRTETHISDAQREDYEFVVDKLGADLFKSSEPTDFHTPPLTARLQWLAEYGDSFKDAFAESWSSDGTMTKEEALEAVNSASARYWAKEVKAINDFLKTGGITVKEEADINATNALIDEKIDTAEYKEWLSNLFSGIEGMSGIRNSKDLFTPSGKRRNFAQLYDPVTIDNVIKAMRKQEQTGQGAFGIGNIQGASAQEFGSIAEVKANANRLGKMDEAEHREITKKIQDKMYEIAERYSNGKDVIDAKNTIVEAVSKNETKQGIAKYLKQFDYVYKYTDSIGDDIIELRDYIRSLPTPYFEAKPRRAVSFDEVAVFVIPYDTDVKLKQELLNNGYAIAEYDPKVEGDRQRVVNSFEEYKFSLSDTTETSKGYATFYGRKIADRTVPLVDSEIAPVGVAKNTTTTEKAAPTVRSNAPTVNEEDFAPMTEADANAMYEADKGYIDSFTDADMPPEMDAPIYSPDTTSVNEKSLKNISAMAKDILFLTPKERRSLEDVVQKYSTSETQNEAELFNEIKKLFGEKSWSERIEEVAEIQQILKGYKINVSPYIKRDISDYTRFMRSNFGKISFSKEGIDVDTAYMELSAAYPSFFPSDIVNPTDQLLQMADVANMTKDETRTAELDDDVIQEAMDVITEAVSSYKEKQLLKSVEKDSRAALRDELKKDKEAQKEAEKAQKQAEREAKPTRAKLHNSIIENIKNNFAEKGFDFDEVLKKAKNLATIRTVDNTPQRVMEKALGYKQGQALADETVNKVAQNESDGIKWLNSFTDRKNGVLAQISKQYNIKPGSKKSAAAQMYAEGFYVDKNNEIIEYGDRELALDFPDAKVRENIKGLARDPRIRQIYDDTLNAINESRSRNLYPEIPRLDNYFLHFRAMEDTFSRLGLPFNPNDIRAKDLPTDLNGVTADLKPGQPYFASAKHREGMRTSFDLLGGLERYLSSAKNQIYHIDDIQTLRALRNYIADTYGQAKGLESLDDLSDAEAQERIEQVYGSHLSTFAKFLNEEANVLAGKTTLIDRGLEGIIGRRGITFLNTINGQVGSNMVGWNISSSLTNFLPVAQTFAKTNKFDFTKAFAQTVSSKIGSIFGKTDSFVENNPTIIRRKGAERFYRTPYQKIGDTGYVLMSAVDDISTELIVRTKYNELIRKGMDEQKASFEADKWVSRLMGDRSLGQQPQLFNSKMLGLFTKFQLEVRNQLDSQFYDTVQETKVSNEEIENKLLRNAKTAAKVTSVFVQLAAVQHLYGMAFEAIAGYNPAFDIIDVLIKALGFDDDEDDEDTVLDNLEEGFFALLEDLPYTSTFTGGRIPISSALPIKEFVKGVDQYGNEKSRWETVKETAPYYLLPTGYGQIKKTAQGLGMFSDDHPVAGSYTNSGSLRFPVEETPGNVAQAAVFGQYASENARYYFDNEISPLKEKQIQEYIDVEMPIKDYWQYREDLKGLDSLEEKFDFIADMDLPVEKKNILINNIVDRKEKVDLENYDDFENYEEFDFYAKNTEKYNFLQDNGVSYKEYKADEDTKENYDSIYSWWKNNPEKVTVSKAVTDNVIEYRQYTSELNEIKADKDENGKTISGSAKEKKKAYIWSLPIDYGQKIILYRSLYDSKDDKAAYNQDIIDYLNSRDDITYDEMNTICEELGFTVNRETGYISW